jgi:aspartyl aminopeptidase
MKEADQLLKLISEATSPFHAVKAAIQQLEAAGFEECKLGEEWKLEKGHKYYMAHHGSTLIAFHIGSEADAVEGQLRIAAAHTDFPCLRIKPNPEMKENNYVRVNAEVYGGAILNTWLDRPLSVAGRIALKSNDVFKPTMQLVCVKRPILTIPNLAIHLNKEINKGIELNKQTDMIPIAGVIEEELNKKAEDSEKCSFFMDCIAQECGVDPEEILDYELTVYCAEEGQYIGVNQDFISAPRIDNMTSVQACLTAIIEASREDGIDLIALFDHEEIGSKTKQGAGSMLLAMILEKMYLSLGKNHIAFTEAMAKGLFLSVDVGHAYHPNQKDKYDPVNKIPLNSGVCLKEAAGQSYATDAEGIAIIQQLLLKHQIPYKKFVNRSDGTSGSTFGSIASSMLPMTTVDVGIPLLAMHSARELMGSKDQKSITDLVRALFLA